jgi:hypothetical protein
MRPRLLFTLAALIAAAVVAAAVGWGGRRHACVLRSVAKASYVARNEAALATIPVPRGYRRINSWSIGIPSPDACIPHENGPPYSAFVTWHAYRGPGPAGGFYAHALRGKWSWVGGGPAEATYVQGQKILYVSDDPNGGFLLSMDYKGDVGRGH